MSDIDKDKLAAAGKIALGSARMASAAVTATGHGLLGGFLRNHHMMNQAFRLAKMSFEGGKRQFEEGLDDWRRS